MIGFSDLNETYVRRTALYIVFTANSRLAEVMSVMFAARPLVCAVLCETSKQPRWRRPSTGIADMLATEASIAEITNKYPKAAASVVQQGYKVLSDIEFHARCTPAKVWEGSGCTSVVNRAENRENFCKCLDEKPLFVALFTACTR
jgi:hypothetical protein